MFHVRSLAWSSTKIVGVDANNGIYPVAYAIAEAESKAPWCWFLTLLGEGLDIEANFNYTSFFTGIR